MLGLVKFCLESTKNEDASSTNHVEPMDPDRMAWLQQAVSSMTVDTTRQLLENLALVKETVVQLDKNPNQNIAIQKTCNAIEILTDLCEEIDYAADFAKLDGFSIFKSLIRCEHEELIVKACELIAALAQNNPICQNIAMSTRLLEQLVDFVDIEKESSHVKARSYALYAISSVIRSNQEVRTYFETTLDGLSVLISLLSHQEPDQAMIETNSGAPKQGSFCGSEDGRSSSVYWWRKLRIRSIFLFRTLCSESLNASKHFFEKQAINQVIDQLKSTKDPEIREHLLHALKAFLDSLDRAKQTKSMENSPDLRDIVERIHKSITGTSNDDYDLTDTKSICEELLNLIEQFQTKK